MNYCTKCESYYQKPGTCNCYAAPRVEITQPLTPYIYPTTVPYIPWTTPHYPPFTIGTGSAITTTSPGIMWNGPVSIDNAVGPFSEGL
jgi:hypothetical protein